MASFHNEKTKVVSFNKSFHGRTTTALSVTDKEEYTAPINQSGEVTFLELNDIEGLEKELSKGDVCAVIIEGIQGIGGIRIPDEVFLKKAEELCQTHDTVIICDEIQSGFGRTGKFFAHQHADIKPDIITVAKGMGNGFPVAGTIFSPDFDAKHGRLGSTFGGNHLACTAATAVLEVLENEQLVRNAANIGRELMDKLSTLPEVEEVRGQGLMIGIEFPYAIKEIRQQLIEEEQILTGVSSDPNVLRLLPPLTITSKEADQFINAIKNVIAQ